MKEERIIAKCALSKDKYEHTKSVVGLCKYFAEILDLENKKILVNAAWLHDIGKSIDNEKHNEKDIVLSVLESYEYHKKSIDDICSIIENHKGKFVPKKFILESAILRLCDKIDKIGEKGARKKCKKNLIKIMEYITDKVKSRETELFYLASIRFIQ